jgi:hypothetical protein
MDGKKDTANQGDMDGSKDTANKGELVMYTFCFCVNRFFFIGV